MVQKQPVVKLCGAPRLQYYDEVETEEHRRVHLDSVEECRLASILHNAVYLQRVHRYDAKRVHERSFQVGDFVLHRIQNPTGLCKLKSPYEVHFLVSKVVEPGTYRLQAEDGTNVPNTWHIDHLRMFYA